ncbi:hypothetical protein TEK04_20845 [Klenkia sp. LSe6-5]|uniref:Uncharacterized protein n=1 Tax=Klenkia sesuvii TaxID=3103137 RepID=A0ABU8DZD3_9ACTN
MPGTPPWEAALLCLSLGALACMQPAVPLPAVPLPAVPLPDLAPVHRAAGDLRILAVA